MKNLFTLQLIILSICFNIVTGYAQDSAKKVKPAKPQTVNPYSKYKAPGYYHTKFAVTKPAGPVLHTAVQPVNDTAGAAPTDKSLSGQYHYLLSKVYNYQQPLVAAFHKSIMDTLMQTRHALREAQAKLPVLTKTIDSLNTGIKTSDQTISEANAKVNAIDLLGASVPKSTYNLIMWGLVIIFGAAAVIVISRSGAYSREAKYRTQLYNELDEEYKNYKIKANEKEKKLARELQTERNKLDDMLGK